MKVIESRGLIELSVEPDGGVGESAAGSDELKCLEGGDLIM